MAHAKIAVTSTLLEKTAYAKILADKLSLPFVADYQGREANTFNYLLILTPHYLGLLKKGDKNPFYIDFLSGTLHYRSLRAGRHNETLAKAIKLSPNATHTIVDATAGLGRDSFILATLGYQMILLERCPIIYELLLDAMRRAKIDSELAPIIERMDLKLTDAADWMASPTILPHVIYIDTMFPERKKSASIKKEMVILQDIVGKNEDGAHLLQLALTCATNRVVVKRPRLAENIMPGYEPNYSLVGKNCRFDVYIRQKG